MPGVVSDSLRVSASLFNGPSTYPGQAKIQHLYLATSSDHDVRGLNVAMDNAVRMSFFERLSDLHGDGERSFPLRRFELDSRFEGLALNVLESDEGSAVCLAYFIN